MLFQLQAVTMYLSAIPLAQNERTKMNTKIETQTHWNDKDFKAWCEENNKDFDKWLSRVGYHFMRSIWRLDDVGTVEEFEKFARDIYRTFDY